MDDAALVGLYWARDERAIPATAENTVPTAPPSPETSCPTLRTRRSASAMPICRRGTPFRPTDPPFSPPFWASSPAIWR